MPVISTLGAMSSRGLGEFARQTAANYIEDVFSTYLYTGNGSTQTITNGIDLAGKGGLVWIKQRDQLSFHYLTDTVRGNTKLISSNDTGGEFTGTNYISSFGSSGFSIGSNANINSSASTYASWTFRKQPKFFDVVTYSGSGSSRAISHNLGSTPGMIIIKCTNNATAWFVYHKSLGSPNNYLLLNTFAASQTDANVFGGAPTATTFTVGASSGTNAAGSNYVAYLFADNAGGFGADGSQNVISCGTFTYPASYNPVTINLGWEPQFVLMKNTSNGSDGIGWVMVDNIRGIPITNVDRALFANAPDAESSGYDFVNPNATGFTTSAAGAFYFSNTYIYMAIRRGPMKTPTDATKVFTPVIANSVAANTSISTTNLADAVFYLVRGGGAISAGIIFDRLRGLTTGTSPWLGTAITNSEFSQTANTMSAQQNTGILDNWTNYNLGAINIEYSVLSRAPGFFDVVCYTGTGSATTVSHNLGVVPELMIVKNRSAAVDWCVYQKDVGASKSLFLNTSAAPVTSSLYWNNTNPTNSVFTVNSAGGTNASGSTYVAYLFASCPGVSKVGTYTGTGATQTISCGFTGGARYVLIKRTDSTGDWWVWDTARGMVSGTDPRLAYNSTAAETNANWVYTTTGGFQIVTSDATINELPGITWIARTSGFGSSDIFGSASSSTLSVIVGAAGNIFTSSDGITWTSRTSGTSSVFYGATYGNGLFVAVGAGGIIFTSPDGITWTSRTSGISTDLYCVGYANGLFVTGGVNGVLLTSPDGITWTSRTSSIGGGDYIVSFAYGNGTYIIGASTGKLSTSTDGITWTPRTTGFGSSGVFAATFGNNTFVIGGEAGKAATSTDGITWTLRTSGFSAFYAIYGANYANGVFILGGGNGQLSTSTDGITWTARTSGFSTTEIRTVSSLGTTNIIAGRSALLSTNAPSYIYLAIA